MWVVVWGVAVWGWIENATISFMDASKCAIGKRGGGGLKHSGFFFGSPFMHFERYMDSVPLYTCLVQKTNEVCVGLHSLA